MPLQQPPVTPPPTPRVAPFAALVASLLGAAAAGQHPTAASASPQQSDRADRPMYVAPASDDANAGLQAMQLAPGLTKSLVAAEPDLCNVVAFAIDDHGRIFVSETFRIHDGVFDTREHMQWRDEDLACTTVADRVAKYERHLAAEIPGYAAYSERVKLLLDDDGDGRVDRSVVYADGFNELADGIASGVLPVGRDVWFTDIPRLWRLGDDDGDLHAERRDAVFTGFGVHTSLIGHDLHGLVLGPDRRLYFSIGDRGFHVTTRECAVLAHPHEGAVLRCELDGSRLEVVHRGLRNPQELAFDDLGNLFTGDNNSDGGDRARLVQVLPFADSGWRIGFQWLADRGAWNREHMWWPQRSDQPAWIVPPIDNVGDGPSGLVFDPGQGLPERYRRCLFLCDFRGGASYSGIHALRLGERGAGFEIAFRDRPAWGVLATDVDFSPDGALYVSDWVNGWNKTGKGRLYRIERPGQRNDLSLRQTARLLAEDLTARSDAQLLELLHHRDRRVRQAAEFALVDRDARAVLLAAATDTDSRDARLAGVWGLGILARRDPQAAAPLLPLLQHGCADTRAQAARALGDANGLDDVGPKLVALLRDPTARVRREAALALARRGDVDGAAATALCDLLRDNGDRDAVMRHAAAAALAAADDAALQTAARDTDAAVRLGALLARFARGDTAVAAFLDDAEPALRREAARCCYDRGIDGALPALARVLDTDASADPVVAWRALNAARLVGTDDCAAAIAAFAARDDRDAALRREAIEILAEWPEPSGQDRVLGNWRPCGHTDPEAGARRAAALLPQLLAGPEVVAAAAATACAALQLHGAADVLADLARDRGRPEPARTAALEALARLTAPQLDAVVGDITADDPTPLRTAAVRLFAERAPTKATPVLATLCEHAELRERQAAFKALGTIADAGAAAVLQQWLDAFARGEVDPDVRLDVLEAAAQRREPAIVQRLAKVAEADAASWQVCRDGGDPQRGRSIVFDNEATRCTRCHTVQGQGGNAGPVLDGIGARQTRDYLLESLVQPSAHIADGFATTVLQLHDGSVLAGVVTRDQDGAVVITGLDGAAQTVAWDRIASRRTSTDSAMPGMAGPLDRMQLRDVVAFLAGLRR